MTGTSLRTALEQRDGAGGGQRGPADQVCGSSPRSRPIAGWELTVMFSKKKQEEIKKNTDKVGKTEKTHDCRNTATCTCDYNAFTCCAYSIHRSNFKNSAVDKGHAYGVMKSFKDLLSKH